MTESDVKSRIPVGAEAISVLVGTMEKLDRMAVAFVRLSQGSILGNLTEVQIPVRFIFLVLGPPTDTHNYFEVGRSFATLMSDKVLLNFQMFLDVKEAAPTSGRSKMSIHLGNVSKQII